jgi:hypothetical protein
MSLNCTRIKEVSVVVGDYSERRQQLRNRFGKHCIFLLFMAGLSWRCVSYVQRAEASQQRRP